MVAAHFNQIDDRRVFILFPDHPLDELEGLVENHVTRHVARENDRISRALDRDRVILQKVPQRVLDVRIGSPDPDFNHRLQPALVVPEQHVRDADRLRDQLDVLGSKRHHVQYGRVAYRNPIDAVIGRNTDRLAPLDLQIVKPSLIAERCRKPNRTVIGVQCHGRACSHSPRHREHPQSNAGTNQDPQHPANPLGKSTYYGVVHEHSDLLICRILAS